MPGRGAVAVLLAIAALAAGCLAEGRESGDSEATTNVEAAPGVNPGGSTSTQDGAGAAGKPGNVAATVETDPVPHSGDAADDPAIWINPDDPTRSTIIGTDKKGGLAVYDLAGNEIQYRSDGRLNNVDVRDGFLLEGGRVSIATAGNRSDDTIAIYRLDAQTGQVVPVAARPIELGISAYGSCMYRSPVSDALFVFVNDKDGEVEQWELFEAGSGAVDARRVRSFDVGSQTEGCVADDELAVLYIGEEEKGIWKYGAEPDAGEQRKLVDSTGGEGHLEADVEGLTIAVGEGRRGFLLASSQGDSSFAVYRREDDNAFVGSFRIEARAGIDAVEDTDGIDVTTAGLGPRFPHGLFVVQDGKNDSENQNFKLVPWEKILRR